jgi:hypothetical protein
LHDLPKAMARWSYGGAAVTRLRSTIMLSSRLIELIETHADGLTQGALRDLATNPRTPSFYLVPPHELQARVFSTYHSLGQWITDPHDEMVRAEYERWGARRFQQGIPLSEMVYAMILIKHHLGQFVRDHGLLEFSGDRAVPGEFIGVQLYGIQELNRMVSEFFDRAMYYLARGYEQEANRLPSHPSVVERP